MPRFLGGVYIVHRRQPKVTTDNGPRGVWYINISRNININKQYKDIPDNIDIDIAKDILDINKDILFV